MRKILPFVLSPKIFLVILPLIAISAAFYSWVLYQKSQAELNKIKTNPQAAAEEEGKALIAKVGLLITLPEREQPTVATVTDPAKLKDQPFFVRSKNGDKVLIYAQAKKAILYRPSLNKIIDVAPVNIGEPTPGEGSITPSVSPSPTRFLAPTSVPAVP